MIPAAFDYERATSAEHALSLLKDHGEDAKLLAGGHSLLPLLTGGRLGTGKGAAVAKGVEGAAPWRDSARR